MRDADFGCGPHTACYDPTLIDGVGWWPDWLLFIIIAALVLILLWALLKTEAKPKPSLRSAILKIIDDAQNEASNWDKPEAANAFGRVRGKIDKEFADRE